MKKHLNRYLSLGIVAFAVSFLVTTCQKDDEALSSSQAKADTEENRLIQETRPNGITMGTIAFNTAPHRNKLLEKLTIIVPQDHGGIVSLSESGNSALLNGLNVSQDSVVFASFGNKHSYTFATWRDDETSLLENLVLTYGNDTEDEDAYTAYLLRYNFAQGEAQVHHIDNVASVVSFSQDCGWVSTVTACSAGVHDASNMGSWHTCIASTGPVLAMSYVCGNDATGGGTTVVLNGSNNYCYGCDDEPIDNSPDIGDGDDSGTVDPNDSAGGGNDGNANNDPYLPNNNDPSQNPEDLDMVTQPRVRPVNSVDDCLKLKEDISDVPLIKTRLYQLRQGLSSGNFEKGFKVNKHQGSGDYMAGTIQQNSSNGANQINIRPTFQTTVIAHTHPHNVVYKMFSAPDILKMAEMANYVLNNTNSTVALTELTHIVVFKDGDQYKTFALRFDDIATAYNLINILNNPKDQRKFLKDLKKYYDSDNTGYPTYTSTTTLGKQQRHIFNLLDDNNLNMSLYEANFDNNGHIDSWQKINSNNLAKEPCN